MRKPVTLLVLMLLVASLAIADTPKAADKAAQQKAAMDAMMRAATPGDAHKKLNAMVGTFDAKIKMWMEPGAPPMESTGKAVNEWVLGGRYVQQRFDGTFMGQPFSGIGYTGYDNVRHMYVGTWMDSMSTSMMNSSGGDPDPSAKNWRFSASSIDPVSGESVNIDERMTLLDNDHQVFEMYGPGPDGTNFKMMEITYTRKK
jgi:hypothetical protein